jgi:AraC-like DNA-binding protein
VNEALFLSETEDAILNGIMLNIQLEYQRSIDQFSQNIIISQLEVMLSYAQRFYQRQFVTRKISNQDVLSRLEQVLQLLFLDENLTEKGIPTVLSVADALRVSPNYLSNLLKTLTGKSTQQHIQDQLIGRAKEILSTTGLTISEVAYMLGFQYPQSFNKLFKSKTQLTPIAYRKSFN